jgi:hypothetical protein
LQQNHKFGLRELCRLESGQNVDAQQKGLELPKKLKIVQVETRTEPEYDSDSRSGHCSNQTPCTVGDWAVDHPG